MKAAILKAKAQPLAIEELPEPQPGAGEVVVRVLAAPVLAYAHEVFGGQRDYPLLLPLVPGCGAIGLVEKTGPDATRLKPGQLVYCDPTVRSRDDILSPDILLQGWIAPSEGSQKLQAHFRNGPFAEKMLMPLENAFSLEQLRSIDPAKLAWLNTLLVPYGGLLTAHFQPGQIAMINGATGHFGSAGVAVALAMGAAQVIALGRNEKVLKMLANVFGPRVRPVQVSEDEAVTRKRIAESAAGPIDFLLDLLSPMRDATPTRRAIMAVRPGGTVSLMGGVDADLHLPYKYIMRNSLIVRGQYVCPRHAPLLLAGLLAGGLLPFEPFSVHEFALAEINQAVQYAGEHGGAFQLTVLRFDD